MSEDPTRRPDLGWQASSMREGITEPAAPSAWSDDPVEVLTTLYPRLLATARRLTPNLQTAEDLVQEALVRTLVHHPNLTELTYPLGYTRTVLWRLTYSERRARWTEVPLEVSELAESAQIAPSDQAALIEGLERLGHRQRACVALRYLHGFDDDTIAQVLGCKPSTVRSQMARGLANLRTSMQEVEDED